MAVDGMDGSEFVFGSEVRSVVASFKLSAPPCNVGKSKGGMAGGLEPLIPLGNNPSAFDAVAAELASGALLGRLGAVGTARPKPGTSLLPCSLSRAFASRTSTFASVPVFREGLSLLLRDGESAGRDDDGLGKFGSEGMVGGPELGIAGMVGGDANSTVLSLFATGC